jgi:ribosome-associated toxin RatA of RatAB toxin-antitoxin module
MHIHFNDTRPANAPAAVLFEVLTDYRSYPQFNSAVTNVRVVKKDDHGAEFVADRTTKIGKQVRAYDRYVSGRDIVVERTYEGSDSARSTWTIHPIDADHCTLTIDAAQDLNPIVGTVMKPALRRMFYKINFAPFIEEAERRATTARGKAA